MPILTIPVKLLGEKVQPVEFNSIVSAINSISDSLTNEINDINAIQAKQNSFKPTAGSGLSINIAGGIVKRVSDGVLLNIAPQTLFVPANLTNQWCYLDRNGVAQQSAALPLESYEVCQFTTNATAVPSILDQRSPSFEIKQRQFRNIVTVTKNGAQNITASTLAVVTGWRVPSVGGLNENTALNLTTGIFTAPKTTTYQINVRVRISDTGRSDTGKLSLYNEPSTEIRILAATQQNILNGYFQGQLTANQQYSFRLTSGLAPISIFNDDNTELMINILG